MHNLIKAIRLHAGLNQQEFAQKLEVSFATVNRWENTKAAPNKLAQTKLYALFFASTFWRKMQNIFGECCISKLEKVAKP